MLENLVFPQLHWNSHLAEVSEKIILRHGNAAHREDVGVYIREEGLERDAIEELEAVFSSDAAHQVIDEQVLLV